MRIITVIIFVIISASTAPGQTRAELEKQRTEALKDIEYLDGMLEKTSTEKSESMNELNMIRRKLILRENLIKGLMEEQALLEKRMELNKIAIELMEEDVKILVKEYEKAIKNAQKVSKGRPEMAYILSSKDINQGYKRLRYLQQVAKYRRREAEIIMDLKEEVEENKKQQ
ncbi:MAG: hypothetical protein V2I34_11780, partial [Bacteroidales bacterium]|nr:hypothetical protein [Bacteroidales bacterium]